MDNIRIKPAWTKSKDEIWNEMFDHLDEKSNTRKIPLWTYAAILLIPVMLCCFYSVTEETARGEHSEIRLPDHSTVTLNAESKLSYHPFVWLFSKKVMLQGEACFDVKPGNSFYVQSGHCRIKVLGTLFNVYSRSDIYRVTCLSGRVEVQAGKESIVLHPNMQAVFKEQPFHINNNVAPFTATGWMQGKFVFVETPLQEVIAEVERQYNITVTPGYYPKHFYSGNFSKTENKPEEILEIIGKAFDITFTIE